MELSNEILLCGQIVRITGHFDWDLLSVLLWSHNFITLLRCRPWPLARAWAVRLKSDEEVAGSTSNLTPSSSSTKPECGFGQFVIYDLTAWKPLGILIQAGLSLSYWSQLSNKQLAHSSRSSSSGPLQCIGFIKKLRSFTGWNSDAHLHMDHILKPNKHLAHSLWSLSSWRSH